jgi:hypothetical protein
MKKITHMYMRATFRALGEGDRAERERHATCVSRAIATHRAALPSPWRLGEEESGARAARDVLASRDRDALSAAHMVRLRGAAGPQRRLGRRKRAVSRARYALPATRRQKTERNISKIRIEGMLYSLTRSP